MMSAIEELSKSHEGKLLSKLAPSISSFLLSCYKEDGKTLLSFVYISIFNSFKTLLHLLFYGRK